MLQNSILLWFTANCVEFIFKYGTTVTVIAVSGMKVSRSVADTRVTCLHKMSSNKDEGADMGVLKTRCHSGN